MTTIAYTILQDGYDAGEVEVDLDDDGDHDADAVHDAVTALVLESPEDWTSTRHASQLVHLVVGVWAEGRRTPEWSIDVCVEVPPREPPCADGYEHDYVAPHGLFGGLESNPGVVGKGGGVVCSEACRHCGVVRVTDTWATDDYDGTQGHTFVSYGVDEDEEDAPDAASYFRRRGERAADKVDLDDGTADLSAKGRLYREGFVSQLRDRLRADDRPSDVTIDADGEVLWARADHAEEEEEEEEE